MLERLIVATLEQAEAAQVVQNVGPGDREPTVSGVCQRPFQCCSGVAEAVLFHEHEAEVVLDLGELNFGRRLQISVAGSSIERLCLQKPAAAVVDVAQVLVDLASRQQVAVLVESVARGHPAGDRFVVAAKHS